jgi:hypothetical protein
MSNVFSSFSYVNTNNRDLFCNAISDLISTHCCNNNKVIIYEGYLDHIISNHLSSCLNTYNSNKDNVKLPVYFVSDIRSTDNFNNNNNKIDTDKRIEQLVKQDMELQKQWIEKINPDAALLKMRYMLYNLCKF